MRLLTIALIFFITSICAAKSDTILVHEWGTFTSLQNDKGNTIGGINTDDEPLPRFVHDLLRGRSDAAWSKGIPGGVRNEITMRLETPVMYFHLPNGTQTTSVDVDVQFRGGLLSQFYPDAITNVPTANYMPAISGKTLGTLKWNNLRVGTHAAG